MEDGDGTNFGVVAKADFVIIVALRAAYTTVHGDALCAAAILAST